MAYIPTDIDGIQFVSDPTVNTARSLALGGGTGGAAITTTATDGFVHIPIVAGAPSGVPTLLTGFAPIVLDSTNNKIWIYTGGAWKGVVVS